MLLGISPRSKTEEIIEALRNSSNQYHLTGSRYFGGSTETSDWDFFVQSSDNVRDELDKLGFIVIPRPDKNDDDRYYPHSVTQVWSDDSIDYFDRNCVMVVGSNAAPIHIQLVKDVQKKLKVQANLMRSGALRHIKTKGDRKRVWNMCFDLLDG